MDPGAAQFIQIGNGQGIIGFLNIGFCPVHQGFICREQRHHGAIALGTLSGGWRIIHTMGSKITKLQPVGGFAAETAGAISLFTATHLGIPVSTTHTITGAIIGVGSIKRLSAVRWGVAGRIVWAWILTIPASAAIAALVYAIVAATIAQ